MTDDHIHGQKQSMTSNLNNPSGGASENEEFESSMQNQEEMNDEFVDPEEAGSGGEDFDAMMDQYLDQMSQAADQGQLLKVPVVAVSDDGVLVDIGDKSEGFIPISEFPVVDDKPQVTVGDEIDVVVKGFDAASGLMNLSHREALRRRAWDTAEQAFKNGIPIKGRVTRTVKGGLILDIGTTAFLPASQIDLRRVEDFEEWIGREVEGYVIEFIPEKRRIVLSRRRMLEEQREEARRDVMEKLSIGQEVEASVKRIVDFGAFVDLGGIDGLIPRSEVSWQRNARPEDFMKPGETIRAKVIEIDVENGKITLSRRRLTEDPWQQAAERYSVDSTVHGQVVSLTNYGAFVRLEEGLDGMIHISDMAWDSAGKKPTDYVAPGQEVSAQVLSVDSEARRISLGLKQLTKDPWEDLEARYPKGTKIKGQVTGLTKYGAFVELEPGIEGMVHVSDFSWEKRISQPRDVVQKGDEVEAVVLDVDRERRRISLGVKQLAESPIDSFRKEFNQGDVIEGEVVKVTDFGAFVKLAPNIEGFMHVSQMAPDRVENPADVVKVGETISAKITKIDPETGKISLSRKQKLKEEERRTIASYMKKPKSDSILSFGELLEPIMLEDNLPTEPEAPKEETRKPQPEPKIQPEDLTDSEPSPAPSSEAPAEELKAEEPKTEEPKKGEEPS